MNCDALRRSLQSLPLGAAVAATLAVLAIDSWSTAAEPFWRQVIPRKRVAFDPNADYTLTEEHGPWLIMASSFTGELGEQEARELVAELRTKYNLPAFYYAMTFKLEDERPGRGIDQYGAPIRRRYQRGSQVLEHAVLVGEFAHIDDPEAQNILERIKTLEPEALKVESGEPTAQSLIDVRQFHRALNQKLGRPVTRGPMGHAFLTRNPLLPKEYFVPPGVDPEVAKWNKDVDHSLLECPGKFSIKVATFRGRTLLKAANDDIADDKRTRQAKEKDPLVQAAVNAHDLTVALRAKGWEAYEFHDRHESYVCVGSFDDFQRSPDGRIMPTGRDAQIIIRTFGAATPNVSFDRAAYQELGVKEQDIDQVAMKEELIKQQFDSRFSKGLGDVAEGFHPKRFVGLPFDIQPEPIEAPKQSISSAYVRN
jgi:hypothetical protein